MTADTPAPTWAASVAEMSATLRARGVDAATAWTWALVACRHIPFRVVPEGPIIRSFRRLCDGAYKINGDEPRTASKAGWTRVQNGG